MWPVLEAQSEEVLEEAREEEEVVVQAAEEVQRRGGGFIASNMVSVATPSSCRRWMDVRVEDHHHRLNNMGVLLVGQV